MLDATAYIVACNEAHHIGRALESLREFREVVVVDSGSTDATCAIVQSYPNTRLLHRRWPGYAAQKQFALDQCTSEWVLNIDADEEVSPALLEALRATIEKNDVDALFTAIPDFFLGRLCRTWKIVKKVRFFRRALGHYDLTNHVHEQIVLAPGARIGTTPAPLHHHGMTSQAKAIDKQNAYSTLKAEEKYAKGKRASLAKLIFAFPQAFIRNYFFKKDCLDGIPGFISAVNAAYYAFSKEAKLFELGIRHD